MKIKKTLLILSFAAAVFTANTVWAKTADLGFHIGKVLSAEISSAPVEILELEKFPYPVPAKKVYALAVLKMDKNRSLSSVDYSLIINGITVPCAAIVCNMAPFVCNPEPTFPSEKDYARLLFVLDGNKVKIPAAGKTLRGTLKTNIRGRNNVTLNLLSTGTKSFSDCTQIPAAGALK